MISVAKPKEMRRTKKVGTVPMRPRRLVDVDVLNDIEEAASSKSPRLEFSEHADGLGESLLGLLPVELVLFAEKGIGGDVDSSGETER